MSAPVQQAASETKPLRSDERDIYDAVRPALAEVEAQVRRDHTLDVALLIALLIAALKPVLIARAEVSIIEYIDSITEDTEGEIDDDFGAEIEAWADEYARAVAERFAQHTQEIVAGVRAKANALGWDDAAVLAALVLAFGDLRARVIAITENSVAVDAGAQHVIERVTAAGLATISYWQTQEDERVCSVCDSLDGLPEEMWGGYAIPAHPNCRCRRRIVVEWR